MPSPPLPAECQECEIRRGVAVSGLSTNDHRRPGIPHVTGVVTEHDGTIAADLVVDAGGRRSALPAWLEAIDARQPTEERDDSGFVYYGRHFRSPDGSVPPCKNKILTHHDSLSILTLPADNGTWGVGFVDQRQRQGAAVAARHGDVGTGARRVPDGRPLDGRRADLRRRGSHGGDRRSLPLLRR